MRSAQYLIHQGNFSDFSAVLRRLDLGLEAVESKGQELSLRDWKGGLGGLLTEANALLKE